MSTYENVNHYESRYPACIEFNKNMTFVLGNIFKYIYRHDMKGTKAQDLKKAKEYFKIFKEMINRDLGNSKFLDHISPPFHNNMVIPFSENEIQAFIDLVNEFNLEENESTLKFSMAWVYWGYHDIMRNHKKVSSLFRSLARDYSLIDIALKYYTEEEIDKKITVPECVIELYIDIVLLECTLRVLYDTSYYIPEYAVEIQGLINIAIDSFGLRLEQLIEELEEI